jgi:hypothetical protein
MSLLDDYQQANESFDYEKQLNELDETYEEWKDIEYKYNKKNKDINEIINRFINRFIISYIWLLMYCMKFLVLYINNNHIKYNNHHIKYNNNNNNIEELD